MFWSVYSDRLQEKICLVLNLWPSGLYVATYQAVWTFPSTRRSHPRETWFHARQSPYSTITKEGWWLSWVTEERMLPTWVQSNEVHKFSCMFAAAALFCGLVKPFIFNHLVYGFFSPKLVGQPPPILFIVCTWTQGTNDSWLIEWQPEFFFLLHENEHLQVRGLGKQVNGVAR